LDTDVVVIGAGQAGLSAAYGLRRAGLAPGTGFVVLDGEDGPGGAWRHRWPTLRVDRAHRIASLPGLPFEPADPTRPAAEIVPAYFDAYERAFDLQVRPPVRVRAVRPAGPDLEVDTDQGTWPARALINATGTWTRPFRPRYPGAETFRGRHLHTVDYPGPDEFAGQRVVVVGGGTSAVQLLMEIAPVAAGPEELSPTTCPVMICRRCATARATGTNAGNWRPRDPYARWETATANQGAAEPCSMTGSPTSYRSTNCHCAVSPSSSTTPSCQKLSHSPA
jgi:hypothetical protein